MEQALNEVKLVKERENEQLRMQVAEIEGRYLRLFASDDDLIKMIDEIDNGEKMHTVAEAKIKINKLRNLLMNCRAQINLMTKQNEQSTNIVQTAENKLKQVQRDFFQQERVREYYQHILLKLTRETDMLQGQSFKIEKFDAVDEYNGSLHDQVVFMRELDLIQMPQEYVDFTNRYRAMVKFIK